MQHVGDEIETRTKAFSLPGDTRSSGLRVLDLCMAPGGFSASAVKYSQDIISICAITLPHSQGGFKLLFESPLLQIQFQDITMLATEFGATDIPPTHPDRAEFVTDRPFEDESFDLVFCGGQVLRSHSRGPHREQTEPLRLRVSQLILALQRIRKCGSLVMLMHKADAWDTVKLVHQISRFAAVALIKPKKSHAAKGTFYLVAKNVQPEDDAAKEALVGWKKSWWDATFGGEDGLGGSEAPDGEDSVKKLLDEYGKEYAKQVRHVWKIQVDALSQKLEGLRSQTDTLSKQERMKRDWRVSE